MRKIFLTAMAVLSIASAQVFGMYGVDTDWITFLTDANQFRARLDQLGFTLGNDTIKGTFGFDNNMSFGGIYGSIFKTGVAPDQNGQMKASDIHYDFVPTISMGLGYTSSLISVGVGYNVTIGQGKIAKFNGKEESKNTERVGHTPVLVLNALDNALRIAVPIQVYVNNDKYDSTDPKEKSSETAVSLDAQIRYYTGLEVLPQIRFYLRYGYYGVVTNNRNDMPKDSYKAETFGFDFRLYFGSMVEEVALEPSIRISYDTALSKSHAMHRIQAIQVLTGSKPSQYTGPNGGLTPTDYGKQYYKLSIKPTLGLSASSDIVTLFLEPSLGLAVEGGKLSSDKDTLSLDYGVYSEITLSPLKNLNLYLEAELSKDYGNQLEFNAQTGITWYLPQF